MRERVFCAKHFNRSDSLTKQTGSGGPYTWDLRRNSESYSSAARKPPLSGPTQ